MTTSAFVGRLASAIAACLLVACGGGGSGDSASGAAVSGINGGGISGINGGGRWLSQGPASAFGSVIVNGVRYSTNDASITIGGAPATEADLAAGQVLLVEGTVDLGGATGRAERVVYEHSVRGPVEAVDLPGASLTVLGQPVRVTPSTIYAGGIEPSVLDSIAVGDQLQVSGLFDSLGRLSASRIARESSATAYEVIGRVASLDTNARRFRINALTVDYATAALDGFGSGSPANGDVVRAQGASFASAGVLRAGSVSHRASGVPSDRDDNVDVEGLVTRFASSSDFDVAGQPVTVTASTQFVGGTAAGIGSDVLLDVEGRIDAGDRLVAARVEIIPVSNIEIEARLDNVDSTHRTLGVLGIEVATDARTRYDDDDHAFDFDALRVGDSVDIAAYIRDGRVFAARIERDDDDATEVEVLGPATDPAAPDFRIAGIRITTDAETGFDDITPAEFFATAAGRIVEVEGIWTGTAVLAEEVELED